MLEARQRRGGLALALLLLLSLWLAGQGTHDLLVHAGPPEHGESGHHATCWLFHGFQVMDAVPPVLVAPLSAPREVLPEDATPRFAALPLSRPSTRGPPTA